MRLYWSSRSPYVRKVMVIVHELGLDDRIDLVPAVVSLRTAEPLPDNANPLGQIPTLVLADGEAIFDSTVICDYLCDLAGDTVLCPTGPAGLDCRRRNALGHGVMDNMVRFYSERRRGTEGVETPYATASRVKFLRTLDMLDGAVCGWPQDRFDLGDAAICAALGYLDFRYSGDWRGGRDALVAWFDRQSDRPSMRATAHVQEG